MKELIKRLELIKTAIAIEDNEIIELQVQKISLIKYNNEVAQILALLLNNDYENIVTLIENYIKKYSGIILYEDPEIQGLKIELKNFEDKLQKLSDEKSEYIHTLDSFNDRYSAELGELIQKILQLKKELSFKELQETDENTEEYTNIEEEYKENKQNYDNFNHSYETYLDNKQLQLNEAYSKNNLEKVSQIFKDLESKKSFDFNSETINDTKVLKQRIKEVKIKIDIIQTEIFDILEEEDYKVVISIDDYDIYFDELRDRLETELNELSAGEKNGY